MQNTASHGTMQRDIFFRTSNLPDLFNQGKQLHLHNTATVCWSKTPSKNSHFVAGNVQYDNFSKSLHISRKVSSQYQILRKMEYFLTTTGTNCIISVNHVYVTFYTKCPFVVSIQNKGGDEIIILVQWVISGCWGQER